MNNCEPRPLVIVETSDKKHAVGVYCPTCKSGTNEVTFWGFETTIGLHKAATGHKMIYVTFVDSHLLIGGLRVDYTVKPIDQWPDKLRPAHQREKAKFISDFNRVFKHLERELKHLGARSVDIFLGVLPDDIRLDGKPRAGARPGHPGVIISFESKHGPLTYWTDRYKEWVANLRALSLGLEALRSIDRYGMGNQGAQYKGYQKRLTAGNGLTSEQQAAKLMLQLAEQDDGEASIKLLLTNDQRFKEVYRAAASRTHPDRNEGRADKWNLLQGADEVLKARKR